MSSKNLFIPSFSADSAGTTGFLLACIGHSLWRYVVISAKQTVNNEERETRDENNEKKKYFSLSFDEEDSVEGPWGRAENSQDQVIDGVN